MRLIVACTLVHALLRASLPVRVEPPQLLALHALTPGLAAGSWLDDPRGTFVPHCQSVVHVAYEDYLPLSAIEQVCTDVGNHAGCHAWGDKLTAVFKSGAGPDEYVAWCGGFYDWFHTRFSSRCTTQCEKYACYPICAYADSVAKIDTEEAEIARRDMVVNEISGRVTMLTRELDNLNQTEQRALQMTVRGTNNLGTMSERRDAARRTYDAAQSRFDALKQRVLAAESALETTRDIEEAADSASVAAGRAVDQAGLQQRMAGKAVVRNQQAWQSAFDTNKQTWSSVQALRQQVTKVNATLTAKKANVAKAEERHAVTRTNLQKRMQNAKQALQATRAERAALKEELDILNKRMASLGGPKAKMPVKKQIKAANMQQRMLGEEEKMKVRQVGDLKVAMKLLSEAEKATANKARPLKYGQVNLAKLEQKVFAAEGAHQEAKIKLEDTGVQLEGLQAAEASAADDLANYTANADVAGKALVVAGKATKKAVITKKLAAEAVMFANKGELAPAEAGLELAGKEVATAQEDLESAISDHAEAKAALEAGKAAKEKEERALAAQKEEIAGALEELNKRREELGPPPTEPASL